MQPITTTAQLETLCAELAARRYITVDTEFMRERTFWPRLCLIQIAAPDMEGALIDPLSEGLELTPFHDLLCDESVIKVMHGCRQDIEIFHHDAEIIPSPLFDTQIAAMVCGFGDAVGYETLVRKTSGGKIDKTSRFTDWSRRPLSDPQLAYALADVTHLCPAFEALETQLDENGRRAWADEEMAKLRDPELYRQSPEHAWKRLRIQERRPRALGVLVTLAEWRDTLAQKRDVPRGRVLKDDTLRELSLHPPADKAALSRLRSLPRGYEKSRDADRLLEAVQRGLDRDPDTLPEIAPAVVNRPGIGPLVELLKVLLRQRAEETGVAPKLIATVSDLERIASDDAPDVAALKGWRHDIFGRYASDLKEGRLALASKDDRVTLIPLD